MIYPEEATQLTAVGVSKTFPTLQNTHHTIVALVDNINTNVVLRAEGTIDGTNYFNLSDADTDRTITAGGPYAFVFYGILKGIRIRFVSESGGTTATVDVKYIGA